MEKNIHEIKTLWDEGVKFSIDEMNTSLRAINTILQYIEQEAPEDDRITDLEIILKDLRNICKSNYSGKNLAFHPRTTNIISQYFTLKKSFDSMDEIEQFGILKAVAQKIIYKLSEKRE